jgi:hypothetical protein
LEYPALRNPGHDWLWKWRHFTMEGVVAVALNQLGRLRPDLFQPLKDVAKLWLFEHRYHIPADYLANLSHITPDSIWACDNHFELRLYMCELSSRPHLAVSPEAVEEFFLRTHYEGELPHADMEWSKQTLHRVVERHSSLAA